MQRSFLDAFLRGNDRSGWSVPGKLPPIDLALRKGDFGHNSPDGERKYSRRAEAAWPMPHTQYTQYHLTPDQKLATKAPTDKTTSKICYAAHGTLENPQLIHVATNPVEVETEITGHSVAHLCVSMNGRVGKSLPSDIDLFLTLRHITAEGKEVWYTGTAGDPVPHARVGCE